MPDRLTSRVALYAIALASLVAAGLIVVAPTGATTAPQIVKVVKVTLTEQGVLFTPTVRPDTNTTLFMRVVNRSRHPRWFQLGRRKTRTLPYGDKALVYVSLHLAVPLRWASGGPGTAVVRGRIPVVVAKGF